MHNKSIRISISLFVLSFLSSIIIVSCSTGKSALNKGEYYKATLQAVKRLQKNPSSNEARGVIQQSYPMAINFYKQKIDEVHKINHNNKFALTVNYYKKLNKLADAIRKSPAAIEETGPVIYFHDQLAKAKEYAAQEQYEVALDLMDRNTIDKYREAYYKLKEVNSYFDGYRNVKAKMEEAKIKGTIRVVVNASPIKNKYYYKPSEEFYKHVHQYINRSVEKSFLHFLLPNEAEKLDLPVHQVIHMNFEDFTIGNVHDKEVVEEFKSDSVVVGEYSTKKGETKKVYGVVSAKVRTFTRHVTSNGVLYLVIKDYVTNETLREKAFGGEFVWSHKWATFNGDERAVPAKKKKLIDNKQVSPPAPQEMFELFTQPIYDDATSFLKGYYRNY